MGWWERSSPNPLVSDAAATIGRVPLDRPPRPPAGAVTDRVRRSIIATAERLGIQTTTLLALHAEAENLGSVGDLLDDAEERYSLPSGSLSDRASAYLEDAARASGFGQSCPAPGWFTETHGPTCVLLALPDTEFLTVLEHCTGDYERVSAGMAHELFKAADGALRAHGAPYRRHPDAWRFEWVGDPAERVLTVQPALLALGDPRFDGPRAEFEEALRKRRRGAAKDLEDAIDEAAKSVESVLQVLLDEHGVVRTGKEAVHALFTALTKAKILPQYVSSLVTAAAGPRNAMAAHGQGGSVRLVPEELADASIAAAATAITFLAHYLP